MLKVTETGVEIKGGLVDTLAEYAALTAYMFIAIGKDCGPAVAETMGLKAFIMGHHSACKVAGAQKEAPDA